MSEPILTDLVLLVLKATVLLGVGGLLSVATRRAPAAVRHLVWTTALGALLVLPLLQYGLPRWTLPVLPAGSMANALSAAPLAPPPPVWAAEGASVAPPAPPTPMTPATSSAPDAVPAAGAALRSLPLPRLERPALLLLVWAAGTLAVLAWVLVGQLAVRRLRRSARPVTDAEWLSEAYDAAWLLDITRPVALLRGERLATPMTWGLVWPAVLLPGTAEEWSAERRRMVLLHELAHVRRKDCLTQLVAHLACALFWFHPLVWYAARRLRVERERACDDLVVRAGASAADYADHLLQVARTLRVPRASAMAIAMARPSQLEGRLLAVLDTRRNRGDAPRPIRLAAALGIALVALPLATLQPGVAAPRAETAAASAAAADGATRQDELRWHTDNMARGEQLAVYTINGPIRASVGGGRTATVVASVRAARGNERDVRIETVRQRGVVAICLVPEGATCTADGIRDARQRGDGMRREGTRNTDITVQLPDGVSLRTESMNGALRLDGIGGDVRALTMNGAIVVSARGVVHARTMNGAIVASMGRTDWNGELQLETMNGRIRVTLPAETSTEVDAHTMAGRIESDFPISISGRSGTPTGRGTIGAGGRSLKLRTMNGGIEIRRVGSAAAERSRSGEPHPVVQAQTQTHAGARAVATVERERWEPSGSRPDFERSIEQIAEGAASLGGGIAEAVVEGLLGAFMGERASTRAASPEVYVRRLREDPDAEVRRVAAWALGRSPGGEGTRALGHALVNDRSAGVREMAAWSLGSLRAREGAAALRQAVSRDADGETRATAFWALERIAVDEVVPLLPALANNRSTEVRQRAVWLVGDQRLRGGFDLAVRALGDDDADVRQAAAWSLGRLGDPRALPQLARALDDRSADVRSAALWAATRIDDAAAAPLVEKATRDRSADIRRQALGAMAGEPWPWPWPWPRPMPRPAP